MSFYVVEINVNVTFEFSLLLITAIFDLYIRKKFEKQKRTHKTDKIARYTASTKNGRFTQKSSDKRINPPKNKK